jgi:hypothetical protein
MILLSYANTAGASRCNEYELCFFAGSDWQGGGVLTDGGGKLLSGQREIVAGRQAGWAEQCEWGEIHTVVQGEERTDKERCRRQ